MTSRPIDREVVVLRAFKLGLYVTSPKTGHTYGMQDDGYTFVVAKDSHGHERRLGVEMTLAWFFSLVKELSEDTILELKANIALNEMKR